LFDSLKDYILSLGDDVQPKTLKLYFAFKRTKNFACVEVSPQKSVLLLFLKVNPETVTLNDGFARDVRKIGHWGTGDLEVTLRDAATLERAKPLILRSYDGG